MKSHTDSANGETFVVSRSVTLFISYAHSNKNWMRYLIPLLNGFQNDDQAKSRVGFDRLSTWHDQELKTGDRWDPKIQKALGRMDIFVPLVSHGFFASEYIIGVEMPIAVKRYENKEILVVPILLEDVNLRRKCNFLHQFQPLPAFGKWWGKYNPRSNAHRLIDDGLWDAIEKACSGKR